MKQLSTPMSGRVRCDVMYTDRNRKTNALKRSANPKKVLD